MLCCCVLRLEGLAGQWNLLTWTHTIKALQSPGAYQGAAELRAAMSGPVRPQVRCLSAEPWLGPGGVKKPRVRADDVAGSTHQIWP